MGGEGLHSMWLGGFTSNLNRLKIPLAWVSPHYCFAGEVGGGGGGVCGDSPKKNNLFTLEPLVCVTACAG